MKIKAIFLDRDGVINEDFGYVGKVVDFKFIDGVFEALQGFISLGYELFIITNQSGIARGFYTQDDFDAISKFMLNEFEKNSITIKAIYHCPHSPSDECECRKPRPGMILNAASKFNIALDQSIMVGDKDSDIKAAKAAGVGRSYKVDKEINLKKIYTLIKEENV